MHSDHCALSAVADEIGPHCRFGDKVLDYAGLTKEHAVSVLMEVLPRHWRVLPRGSVMIGYWFDDQGSMDPVLELFDRAIALTAPEPPDPEIPGVEIEVAA